jgi:hypothetical protein
MKLAAALAGAAFVLAPTPASAAEARAALPESGWTWRKGVAVGALGATYLAAWGGLSAVWWSNTGSAFALRDEGAFGLDTC